MSQANKTKDYTIEWNGQMWWIWKHDIYPRHSVLAGACRRTRVTSFKTKEEAQMAYPTAREWRGSSFANACFRESVARAANRFEDE